MNVRADLLVGALGRVRHAAATPETAAKPSFAYVWLDQDQEAIWVVATDNRRLAITSLPGIGAGDRLLSSVPIRREHLGLIRSFLGQFGAAEVQVQARDGKIAFGYEGSMLVLPMDDAVEIFNWRGIKERPIGSRSFAMNGDMLAAAARPGQNVRIYFGDEYKDGLLVASQNLMEFIMPMKDDTVPSFLESER